MDKRQSARLVTLLTSWATPSPWRVLDAWDPLPGKLGALGEAKAAVDAFTASWKSLKAESEEHGGTRGNEVYIKPARKAISRPSAALYCDIDRLKKEFEELRTLLARDYPQFASEIPLLSVSRRNPDGCRQRIMIIHHFFVNKATLGERTSAGSIAEVFEMSKSNLQNKLRRIREDHSFVAIEPDTEDGDPQKGAPWLYHTDILLPILADFVTKKQFRNLNSIVLLENPQQNK